jgi:Copper type II ascorbate-dependent monooxygenase, C-terminal domain
MQPGDEIRVDCTYQSLGRNTSTKYGESTSDEMCYGFITYYPSADKFTLCNQWRTVNICSNVPLQCDISSFYEMSATIYDTCGLNTCSKQCKLTVATLMSTGCVTGDMGRYFLTFSSNLMLYLFYLVDSCGLSLTSTTAAPATVKVTAATTSTSGTTSSMEMAVVPSIVICAFLILLTNVVKRW